MIYREEEKSKQQATECEEKTLWLHFFCLEIKGNPIHYVIQDFMRNDITARQVASESSSSYSSHRLYVLKVISILRNITSNWKDSNMWLITLKHEILLSALDLQYTQNGIFFSSMKNKAVSFKT